MRLSKQFVKSLEALASDARLTPNERLEAAGLLVRLYTSPAAISKTPSPTQPKPKAESDTLAQLADSL